MKYGKMLLVMKVCTKLVIVGRVKSYVRTFERKTGINAVFKSKIKKQCETSKRNGRQGYLCTRLTDSEGKSSTKLVHILVAKAFIPNPQNKETVNHIDGNKHNNSVENLEWCTYSENNVKAVEKGLREKYIGFLRNYKKEEI